MSPIWRCVLLDPAAFFTFAVVDAGSFDYNYVLTHISSLRNIYFTHIYFLIFFLTHINIYLYPLLRNMKKWRKTSEIRTCQRLYRNVCSGKSMKNVKVLIWIAENRYGYVHRLYVYVCVYACACAHVHKIIIIILVQYVCNIYPSNTVKCSL